MVGVDDGEAGGTKVPVEITEAVRNGEPLPDSRLNGLATVTTTVVETRGQPSCADVQAFLEAGFTGCDLLQVVMAIAVMTISNLFQPPVPHPCG